MADVLVLVTAAGFFGLCVAYIRWCNSIIGDDPVGSVADDVLLDDATAHGATAHDPAPVAATPMAMTR